MATTETKVSEWLTVKEAAELANVSRTHIWRLATGGAFPAVRVGPHDHSPLRIRRDVFLDWLEGPSEED